MEDKHSNEIGDWKEQVALKLKKLKKLDGEYLIQHSMMIAAECVRKNDLITEIKADFIHWFNSIVL